MSDIPATRTAGDITSVMTRAISRVRGPPLVSVAGAVLNTVSSASLIADVQCGTAKADPSAVGSAVGAG